MGVKYVLRLTDLRDAIYLQAIVWMCLWKYLFKKKLAFQSPHPSKISLQTIKGIIIFSTEVQSRTKWLKKMRKLFCFS